MLEICSSIERGIEPQGKRVQSCGQQRSCINTVAGIVGRQFRTVYYQGAYLVSAVAICYERAVALAKVIGQRERDNVTYCYLWLLSVSCCYLS